LPAVKCREVTTNFRRQRVRRFVACRREEKGQIPEKAEDKKVGR